MGLKKNYIQHGFSTITADTQAQTLNTQRQSVASHCSMGKSLADSDDRFSFISEAEQQRVTATLQLLLSFIRRNSDVAQAQTSVGSSGEKKSTELCDSESASLGSTA